MTRVLHLYVSPGHNFFGHHEMPAGDNALVAQNEIECVAGRGIRGDRFFDYKKDYKGQITFFSSEIFDALCRDLRIAGRHPGLTRRNVITAGLDLGALIGKRFTIQGIEFEGTGECTPCYWMDQAIGLGAEKWLVGRGGLRAKILTDGILRVDPTPGTIA